MKNISKILLILTVGFSFSSLNFAEETNVIQTVIVEGIGTDIQSASQNAAQNALTNVVGSFMDANVYLEKRTIINNGIKNQTSNIKRDIKEYSQGSIKSFEILDSKNDNGLIKITSKVSVRIDDFKVYIKKLAEVETSLAPSFMSLIDVEKKNRENLGAVLSGIISPIINGEVIEISTSKPQVGEGSYFEYLVFDLQISIKQDFKENFLKTIQSTASDKVSINSKFDDINFSSFARSIYNSGIEQKKHSQNKAGLIVSNNSYADGYLFNLPMSEITKFMPWYSDCKGGQIRGYDGPQTPNMQITFSDDNNKILATERITRSNRNSNAFVMFGPINQSSPRSPWIPLHCQYSNISTPVINLDTEKVKLFVKISQNIATASGINIKLIK